WGSGSARTPEEGPGGEEAVAGSQWEVDRRTVFPAIPVHFILAKHTSTTACADQLSR
ncbi:unnamed protein product, partial [Gadus morhua 'NCC']